MWLDIGMLFRHHNFWTYRYFFCELLAFVNVVGNVIHHQHQHQLCFHLCWALLLIPILIVFPSHYSYHDRHRTNNWKGSILINSWNQLIGSFFMRLFLTKKMRCSICNAFKYGWVGPLISNFIIMISASYAGTINDPLNDHIKHCRSFIYTLHIWWQDKKEKSFGVVYFKRGSV